MIGLQLPFLFRDRRRQGSTSAYIELTCSVVNKAAFPPTCIHCCLGLCPPSTFIPPSSDSSFLYFIHTNLPWTPHSLEDVGFRLMVPHVEAAIGICNGLLVKITPRTIMIPTGGKEVVVGEEDAEGDVVSPEELLTLAPPSYTMASRLAQTTKVMMNQRP